MSLTLALTKLPLPTLEVAEVLAALGPTASHASLIELIGKEHELQLRREVDRLTELGFLLWGSLRLEPNVAGSYRAPLRLGPSVQPMIDRRTVPDLQKVVAAWREPVGKQPRRAVLAGALERILSDRVRIAEAVGSRPADFQEVLRHAAFGRPVPSGDLPTRRRSSSPGPFQEQIEWAKERMILVPSGYGTLTMPGPVALAVRGSQWRARFTPAKPVGQWQEMSPVRVEAEAAMAAAAAHRVLGDLLRQIGRTPVKQRKDGAVGAVELRRLGKALGLPAERVPMLLGLVHVAGLIELGQKVTVSDAGQVWQERDPAEALAQVLQAWLPMPDTPGRQEDLSWAPTDLPGVVLLRRALLEELAAHPGQAPVGQTLAERLLWSHPAVLTRSLNGPVDGMPFTENEHGAITASQASPQVERLFTDGFLAEECADCLPLEQRAARAISALVEEAGFLGVISEGVLSPIGSAVNEGGALEAALETLLGSAKDEVVLQADLTATVLGQPSGRLITTLDQLADREGRSAATVWRFSASSVRSALDAGWSAEGVLAELAEISRVEIPQPLAYLVRDVARSHGSLRGADCVSYLRSEDASLLAQVAADRKLRRYGLQQIAPTVLVSSTPFGQLLVALRSAGYAPVQEAPGGATVSVMANVPRQEPAQPGRRSPQGRVPLGEDERRTLVERLMKEPDQQPYLIDLGGTVVDMRSLQEHRDLRS